MSDTPTANTSDTQVGGLTREGSPRQRNRFTVPSTWIAKKTGFSRTGIYRMRTEHDTRPPGLPRMRQMEATLGWSQHDQLAAHNSGRWIEEFERVVLAVYNREHGRENTK